jgi:hypothetical protein
MELDHGDYGSKEAAVFQNHIDGTDVNVRNGLNRNPKLAIPPVAWNLTIRFPEVRGNWFGNTKAEWPLPAMLRF